MHKNVFLFISLIFNYVYIFYCDSKLIYHFIWKKKFVPGSNSRRRKKKKFRSPDYYVYYVYYGVEKSAVEKCAIYHYVRKHK